MSYKDGYYDDYDACFDYKRWSIDDKGPFCKNNKDSLQNNQCGIDDKKVNPDWLNVIVALQWSLFAKQELLFGNNKGKTMSNDPDCYDKERYCKSNDCNCRCNKLCCHYKEAYNVHKKGNCNVLNEIVVEQALLFFKQAVL